MEIWRERLSDGNIYFASTFFWKTTIGWLKSVKGVCSFVDLVGI
jgi:hypothetical protein